MRPETAMKISERKWRLNPPILVCDGMHENFHKDIVMPFNESEARIGTGSYRDVYEVEIHPSYQRLLKVDPNKPVQSHSHHNPSFMNIMGILILHVSVPITRDRNSRGNSSDMSPTRSASKRKEIICSLFRSLRTNTSFKFSSLIGTAMR